MKTDLDDEHDSFLSESLFYSRIGDRGWVKKIAQSTLDDRDARKTKPTCLHYGNSSLRRKSKAWLANA